MKRMAPLCVSRMRKRNGWSMWSGDGSDSPRAGRIVLEVDELQRRPISVLEDGVERGLERDALLGPEGVGDEELVAAGRGVGLHPAGERRVGGRRGGSV